MRAVLSTTFRSMQVRNYRLFSIGQLVKLVGVWMMFTAQDWLVLNLSGDSPGALGIVTALQFLPVLLLTLWAGKLADRLTEKLRTPMEVFSDSAAQAKELLESGLITLETYGRAVEKAADDYERANKSAKELRNSFTPTGAADLHTVAGISAVNTAHDCQGESRKATVTLPDGQVERLALQRGHLERGLGGHGRPHGRGKGQHRGGYGRPYGRTLKAGNHAFGSSVAGASASCG